MDIKNSNTLTNLVVVKRSGQRVSFNGNKIAIAIKQAFDTVFQTIRLDREYLYQPEEDNCKGCCGIQIGCR